VTNCYEHRVSILKSDLMEIMKQPPFPGMYKTKESVDLETLRAQFHYAKGEDPISIDRFLEFLAEIAKEHGANTGGHGEEGGQGGYGVD
jgi:hypothetical protein